MNFSEYKAGDEYIFGSYLIEEREILEFANRYDPQWFHTNLDRSKNSPYKNLIASGWHTCAIAMRLVYDEHLKGSQSIGSPGLSYLKWPYPVYPGDILSVKVTIKNARKSQSKKDLGIINWRWQMFNSQKLEVLDMEVTSFFDLATK